jgi:hypothetical protein
MSSRSALVYDMYRLERRYHKQCALLTWGTLDTVCERGVPVPACIAVYDSVCPGHAGGRGMGCFTGDM